MYIIAKNTSLISGAVHCPPDKSISHRALILNALVPGTAFVDNLLEAEDVYSTIRVLRELGVSIEKCGERYRVESSGWKEPSKVLDCGNSGTTMRLMMGALAAHPFFSVLTGDASLSARPMKRVMKPLINQGVSIMGRANHRYAPVSIYGSSSDFFSYELPMASAQLKSALMLYGIQNSGARISGIGTSRDHTERMLIAMGAQIVQHSDGISVMPSVLHHVDVCVPGDPSSAAFFVAAGVLCGRGLRIDGVGINPTRIAFFRSLQRMGANISFVNTRKEGEEPVADIVVEKSNLKGIEVVEATIPAQLDELPLLAVVAVFAQGDTVVRGAQELRVKESDRIHAIVHNLRMMGADIEELPDGFIVHGTGELKGNTVSSFGDHRIAMACAVAGFAAQGATTITQSDCVSISFPDFVEKMTQLGANCRGYSDENSD